MAEVKDTTTAFERTVADIAGRFAATPFNQIDEAIVESQGALVEVLGLDQSALWQHVAESKDFVLTHQWARDGVPELPPERQLMPCVIVEVAVPILHSRDVAALVPWVSNRRFDGWRRDGSRGRRE